MPSTLRSIAASSGDPAGELARLPGHSATRYVSFSNRAGQIFFIYER
jgi:hypothetical protein